MAENKEAVQFEAFVAFLESLPNKEYDEQK